MTRRKLASGVLFVATNGLLFLYVQIAFKFDNASEILDIEAVERELNPLPEQVAKKKLIYFASEFFGEHFKFSELPWQCETTLNPRDMSRADAVVFHHLNPPEFPIYDDRTKNNVSVDQAWVLVMYESAQQNMLVGSNFNWTMTYRRDSDIYSPYCGTIRKVANRESLAQLRPDLERYRSKRAPLSIAWMVSNCQTINDRMGYAKELSKYISVNISGMCNPSQPRCTKSSDLCWTEVSRNYKFYLSFESSHCKDYITEKFILPMYYGVLPIVYGGASKEDYALIAPPHSYIDTRDFASPKELADYLIKLDKNPDLYEEYFQWRKYHMVFHQRVFVGQETLCRKLWNIEANRFSYTDKDLRNWWKSNGTCVKPPFKSDFLDKVSNV